MFYMCYLSVGIFEFKFIGQDLRDLNIVGTIHEIPSCSDQGLNKIVEERIGKVSWESKSKWEDVGQMCQRQMEKHHQQFWLSLYLSDNTLKIFSLSHVIEFFIN